MYRSVRPSIHLIIQSTNQSINQSISQSNQIHKWCIKKWITQSINQPTNQPTNQTINQTISQSINQTIKQSTNQSNNQAVNQSINQSVSQSINQSIITTTSPSPSSPSSFFVWKASWKSPWSNQAFLEQLNSFTAFHRTKICSPGAVSSEALPWSFGRVTSHWVCRGPSPDICVRWFLTRLGEATWSNHEIVGSYNDRAPKLQMEFKHVVNYEEFVAPQSRVLELCNL